MSGQGPAYFTPGMLVDGIFLDGVPFNDGRLYPILGWSFPGVGPKVIQMEGGNTIIQHRWPGGPGPMNVTPIGFSMSMSIRSEEDFFTILSIANRHLAVPLWFDCEMPDYWYIPGRTSAAQTAWYSTRLSPWTLPSISFVTKPPRVFFIGSGGTVEQTVISSGTPSAGQVKIAETSADDEAVQAQRRPWVVLITPPDLEETFIELRYRPQILATIHAPSYQYVSHNNLVASFEVHEHLAGVYS